METPDRVKRKVIKALMRDLEAYYKVSLKDRNEFLGHVLHYHKLLERKAS